MRRVILAMVVVLLAVAGCASKSSPDMPPRDSCSNTQVIRTRSSVGAIFPAECGSLLGPVLGDHDGGYWTPTPTDIVKLEADVRGVLERWQASPGEASSQHELTSAGAAFVSREIAGILDRLDGYHRQYVGVVTASKERIIVVNCFPSSLTEPGNMHQSWESRWVSVDDGGNSYWMLRQNADSGEFFGFESNGYA